MNGAKLSGNLESVERINNSELGKVFIGLGININESHGFTSLREHTDKPLDKLDIMNSFSEEFLALEPLLGL